MAELLNFVFRSFWTFVGTVVARAELRLHRAALRAERAAMSSLEPSELLHLLRCARVVAELEEWLRTKEEWRYIQASVVVGEGEMQATLSDGTAAHAADQIVSLEVGPDLLTALESAMEKAKEAGR